MLALPLIPVRYCPSKETLAVLNDRQWIASYSGGKDSTALITYIEWLRRIGLSHCEQPRLVQSDTEIEFPFLDQISTAIKAALTATGWLCEVVRPRLRDKLYNNIFGRGVTPIHPGNKKHMRWCTRSTKVDPMTRFSKSIGDDIIQLTGVRWGESERRDGALSLGGCAAGGECGLPEPGNGKYAPLIAWKTCKVFEWLTGTNDVDQTSTIPDLVPHMRQLVEVYDAKRGETDFWGEANKISSLRFGCIGCPAITNEKVTKSKIGRTHPQWSHLSRIYGIWDALYNFQNRCIRHLGGGQRAIRPAQDGGEKEVFRRTARHSRAVWRCAGNP